MSGTPLLDRSVPFTIERAADDGTGNDGLTLEGYAAVFDQKTEVDSWEGTFLESIRKGAFRKSIRDQTPVLQFEHGRHPLVGSLPIGRIHTIGEDDRGLHVEARVTDNWLTVPVRDAIRDEAITGMSFRFEVVRDEWRDNAGKLLKGSELSELMWDAGERGPLERTLIEVKVRELGPVVFPAYDGTEVSVRARELAEEVQQRSVLRHGVLRALASESSAALLAEGMDAALRREVAYAVLYPARSDAEPTEPTTEPTLAAELAEENTPDAPPATGHPSPDAPPATGHPSPDAPPAPERSVPDAPPATGHPSGAVPPATGHPSQSDQQRREQYMRQGYVTRESVGKRFA